MKELWIDVDKGSSCNVFVTTQDDLIFLYCFEQRENRPIKVVTYKINTVSMTQTKVNTYNFTDFILEKGHFYSSEFLVNPDHH